MSAMKQRERRVKQQACSSMCPMILIRISSCLMTDSAVQCKYFEIEIISTLQI